MKISTALANAMMTTGDLKTLIDTGFLYFFSGPIPASADDAIDGTCVMLDKISVSGGGTGVTFENVVASGVLTKTAAETWSGTPGATGTASFALYMQGADDGTAVAGSNYRILATVGTSEAYDIILASTTFTSGASRTISLFQIQQQLG